MILDEENKFVVLDNDANYEFISVLSTQVSNLKLNHYEKHEHRSMPVGGVHARKTTT